MRCRCDAYLVSLLNARTAHTALHARPPACLYSPRQPCRADCRRSGIIRQHVPACSAAHTRRGTGSERAAAVRRAGRARRCPPCFAGALTQVRPRTGRQELVVVVPRRRLYFLVAVVFLSLAGFSSGGRPLCYLSLLLASSRSASILLLSSLYLFSARVFRVLPSVRRCLTSGRRRRPARS